MFFFTTKKPQKKPHYFVGTCDNEIHWEHLQLKAIRYFKNKHYDLLSSAF